MKIDLSGPWKLSNTKTKKELKAKLPGDNYTSLLEANVISDPFLGQSEKDVQWPAFEDWKWERNFVVTESFLHQHSQIHLFLSEVDTFAKIYLNSQLVGETENMFLAFSVDVKKYLKSGENHIVIIIRSPVKEAEEIAKSQPFFIPWSKNNSVPYMNLIRKVQCHAGWDWGISLIPSGVYGSLELRGYQNCVLENMYTAQHHNNGSCELVITVEVSAFTSGTYDFTFGIDNARFSRQVLLSKGNTSFDVVFMIDSPQLWFPHGYGAQPLYEIFVSVDQQTIQKKIGLRKLEVVNKNDAIGKPLTVRVNDIDIFCKGANWIPSDAFPARQTLQKTRSLLLDAKEVNMNMLRVWGGGQYEKDYFYEMCDEYGILIWQDLMFACSLYPSTKDFLDTVQEEVRYQALRLRDHACLALWCGDNEVIGALNWYKESVENRDTYLINYDRLNRACENMITTYDPTRVFWPSSPCAGPQDFSDNWHNDACGDMHYWSVWHGGKAFDAYYDVKPRFCSEFGYQSFPSLETVKSFCEKEQRNVTSPVMEAHQKNKGGNERMITMMSYYFRLPSDFENILYVSQIQQALAIKTAVEFWRSLRPTCMGTLYWQLNDLWPTASWSSIEYSGKWKQLHYHAKRFYEPVIITGRMIEGKIEIWAVNDLLKAVNHQARVLIYDFEGKIIKNIQKTSRLKGQSAQLIFKIPLKEISLPLEKVFLGLQIQYVEDNRKSVLHENTLFLTEYKKCELAQTNIQMAYQQIADNQIEVSLTSAKPAFFVCLDVDTIEGNFTDNSFTLLPKQTKKVIFQAERKVSLEKFKRNCRIQHLRQTY